MPPARTPARSRPTGQRVGFDSVHDHSPESLNVTDGRARFMPGDRAIAFVLSSVSEVRSLQLAEGLPDLR